MKELALVLGMEEVSQVMEVGWALGKDPVAKRVDKRYGEREKRVLARDGAAGGEMRS